MSTPEFLMQASAVLVLHLRLMDNLRSLSALCGDEGALEGALKNALRGAFYCSVVLADKLAELASEALLELQTDLDSGDLGKFDRPA